ncbi:hypothetical protein DSO57_1031812 [Entomophthora muscae]|uniref:Uncharacterized protein n=1 Tax=Entomophthora muscae TaxID=34485 RepID=A0ACC2TBM2_9FUNG|nr:hypothetical protein DSO57_1031812 [Entomophthora muscae]
MKRQQELQAYLSQRGKRLMNDDNSKSQSPALPMTPTCDSSLKKNSIGSAHNSQTLIKKPPQPTKLKNAPTLPRFSLNTMASSQKASTSNFSSRRSSFVPPTDKQLTRTKSQNLSTRSLSKQSTMPLKDKELTQTKCQKSSTRSLSDQSADVHPCIYLGDYTLSHSVNLANEMGLLKYLPKVKESCGIKLENIIPLKTSSGLEEILNANSKLLKLQEELKLSSFTEDVSAYLSYDALIAKQGLLKSIELQIRTILKGSEKVVLTLKQPKNLQSGLHLDPKYHMPFHRSLAQISKLLDEHVDKILHQKDIIQECYAQKDQLESQSDQANELVSLLKTLDSYSTEFQSLVKKTMVF